jgi:tetratricopeptide (TPR) repeat protein/DNA-binding CsgD family transcriptional regulator
MIINHAIGENIDSYFLQDHYSSHLKIINEIYFTPREIDVISCIISGRSAKKIAYFLSISPRTVENHIHNIMLKIGSSSKENIIDFIEKSGKFALIKKHYSGLLIQMFFEQQLKKISPLINGKPPSCTIISDKEQKHIVAFILQLEKYLKLVGIKITIEIREENNNIAYFIDKIESKYSNYIIYNLPPATIEQLSKLDSENNSDIPYFIQLAHKNKSSVILLIFDRDFSINIPKKLLDCEYIDLKEQGNYYYFIFEILKKLLTNIASLDQNIIEFKKKYIAICDPLYLETILEEDQLPLTCPKKSKWLIILPIMLLIFSTIIVIFKYNKMASKKQRSLLITNVQSTITSYIPEILTGYEHFVGREKALQQIEQVLEKNNIIVINGRAGIGKSSCAIEYGKRHKPNKLVRYFNAAFATKINQQYRELAQELNITVDQQPNNVVMQLVNNKLSSLATDILFIFDNVDQYDDIKEYLANLPTNIRVIITTRLPQLIVSKIHIPLEEFSSEEAIQYLRNSLQNRVLNETLIHELIKNTGTLPYDIKCVAAYLLDHPSVNNQISIDEIGNKVKDKLFQEFTVSSDKTKQQAWKILQYVANLDPDFIGMDIIKKLFPENIELSSNAIKKLEMLSLISIINNQNNQAGFKIHRKLQVNIQNSAKNHPEFSLNHQKLINHLLSVLDQLFPEITLNPNIQQQTAISLQPHVEKLLNIEIKAATEKSKINLSNLYYKLAKYYSAININYQVALKYAKTALDHRYSLYKTNHTELANAYNTIGIIYRAIGNTGKGLKYLTQGLTIRQQLYPKNHSDIADSLYNIGVAYNQHGNVQQGLRYSQMALDMNRQLYSGNHYEIGCALNAVGINYLDLGDFEKSLEYFTESLNTFIELEPVNYEKVAALQGNIAYNYNKLANHLEAIKYAKKSVDTFKKLYPEGHPRAVYSLDDLGESLIKLNNVKQGLSVLHQALNISKNFGLDKHCCTAFVLHDLGVGYFKKKDYHTALEYAEKALNLRRELYVEVKNHHELAETLHNLGDIYIVLNNKDQGLQLYQKALEMYIALSPKYLSEVSVIKQKINKLSL